MARSWPHTWADFINVEMEHGPFDVVGLQEFMRGLVDGGPTRSGHRTPTVIATVPTPGFSEEVIRANYWMFEQVLDRGIHGILLCNADTPAAVKAFVESVRYAFRNVGVGKGLEQGRRGNGGQAEAAPIWDLSVDDYLERADVWPLNPKGELMLGLKIENRRALSNVETLTRVPGITFAQYAPGDMAMSFGYAQPPEPRPPELEEAHGRIEAAIKSAGLVYMDGVRKDTVVEKIKEGVMICSTGPEGEEIAELGRKHTKRTMPW